MNLINLTPHPIVLIQADGTQVTIPKSGQVARVSATPGQAVGSLGGVPLFSATSYGPVEGLPPPKADTVYIVSGLVLSRCIGRSDVVGPGTGPQDGAVRNEKGEIIGVTRLILPPSD